MSQQPFQTWQFQPWNYQQQAESVQQQQHQQQHHILLNLAVPTTHQPMQQDYMAQYLNQDFLTNSQNELQAGRLPQQYQSSLSFSQLLADMFTSGGLPAYSISRSTNKQQILAYRDEQQPNNILFSRQNLFTHQQQHLYSRQHEVQTPMQLDRQRHAWSFSDRAIGACPIAGSYIRFTVR